MTEKAPEGKVDMEAIRRALGELTKKRVTIAQQVSWYFRTYLPKIAKGAGYCKRHDWFYVKEPLTRGGPVCECTMCDLEKLTGAAIADGLNPYDGFKKIPTAAAPRK